MAIVDERGRVGGKVNLIDALVAFLILVLIPISFGAYLLFRTPQPMLTALNPPKVYQGPLNQIEVQGENLRPFMRVSFNDVQGRTYMIGSTRSAYVGVPDLPPGTYDVVLYDHMQEVSKLPKALTILPLAPTPTVDMRVEGAFKSFTADRMKAIKPGDKFFNGGDVVAEVESMGSPVPSFITLAAGAALVKLPIAGKTDIPAVLRLKCFVSSTPSGSLKCSVPGPIAQSDVVVDGALSLAAPGGWVTYQIEKVLTSK